MEHQAEVPQVQVEVRLAEARRYGIKPGDVRRAAAWLMAGEEAGDLFVAGKAYDMQLWSTPETRTSVTDIRTCRWTRPQGGQVLLKDVADVRIVPTPNVIKHVNLFRKIDVAANIDGTRDLGSSGS